MAVCFIPEEMKWENPVGTQKIFFYLGGDVWRFNTWFTYGVTEISYEIPLIQAVLIHTINW